MLVWRLLALSSAFTYCISGTIPVCMRNAAEPCLHRSHAYTHSNGDLLQPQPIFPAQFCQQRQINRFSRPGSLVSPRNAKRLVFEFICSALAILFFPRPVLKQSLAFARATARGPGKEKKLVALSGIRREEPTRDERDRIGSV